MKNIYIKHRLKCLALTAIIISFQLLFPILSKAEKINFFNNCFNSECFSNPNNLAISNDGSFFLLIDSSITPYFRKVKFENNTYTELTTSDLGISNPDKTTFNILISDDDKKAVVYKAGDETIVLIVDLINGGVKRLTSISTSKPITSLDFLNADGNKILATSKSSTNPELYFIDVSSDSIEKRVSLPGLANFIFVSPTYDKVLLSYSDNASDTISIYDVTVDRVTDLTTPSNLQFSIIGNTVKDDFDLKGKYSVVETIGGLFYFSQIDLVNKKRNLLKLYDNADSDSNRSGPTVADISADGFFAVAACTSETFDKFKLYKINTSDFNSPQIVKEVLINGIKAEDIDITPDQNKIYVHGIKNGKRILKIFNATNLNEVAEYDISGDTSSNKNSLFLKVEPYGRYALTPDVTVTTNCLPPNTLIKIPGGEKRIDLIKEGDLIISDWNKAVKVTKTNKLAVSNHKIVKIKFADGKILEGSAGHPTPSGKTFGELIPGDVVSGHTVFSTEVIPYIYSHTYDILPANNGNYYANGILTGSTLSPKYLSKKKDCTKDFSCTSNAGRACGNNTVSCGN